MQLFHCAKNSISGTLPKSYRSWPLIKEFDVQYNQLSGSLPPEFADWRPSLFTLNNNQISSTLPPQYSQWGVSTQYFYLQDCDIYGSLPPSYSNWTYLMGFAIRNSRVSGTLPNEYASWVRIGTFVISYSSLSGTIPSTYNHWSSVTTIDLSNNHLTGTIPGNIWGSTALLTTLALSNNSLRGTLPAQLLQVPQLGYLSVGFNQLSGTIPPIASSQLVFQLFQNNSMMKGSIPTPVSLMVFRLMSICGTSLQCPTGGFFQLYCFPREMLYELTDPVIAVIAPFTTTCTLLPPPPPKMLDRSTTVTREVDAPAPSWTAATPFAPSSASVATSGVTVTIAIASSVLGTSTSALSGGTHGIQVALMTRRKRALCQLSAARSADDNGGPSDPHHSAISNPSLSDNDNDALLCCDAITSPTQLESIASLSPLIGALLGNTALVLILCLIKYSLPFAVRRFPGSNKKRGMVANGIAIALHTMAGEPTGPVSALWSPYMTLLAPTVATAFGAALLPGASARLKAIGALGVCLWVGPWVFCAYALCWRSRRSSFPFQAAAMRGQRSKSWWKRLMEPSINLIAAPSVVCS
ncbi:GP46-like surface antigen, putative [Bodo saltans]|uniref:GP46-like surface antigen, putative n=1 Tax=Bodo saltans TaxID=75058 RepID=A0A0S4JJG5_BODSA|nr:GP46-like surface antigen, putative [Bodo saltans]|eukprot:CUG88583.1 GP46-like surface antigen, putative [Bodo saltans]